MVNFEVFKVCARSPVCAAVSSICQGRVSGQPRHLRCLAGVAAFILKEAETALKACSITRWLVCRRTLRSITAWLRCHSSLTNPLLCGLPSFSVSVFAPYSLLGPQGHPLPLKRKIFRTVCSFITSLLHSHLLGLSEEDRIWFSLLNKSIFITLSSVWCHRCKQSHTENQRALFHQHLPIKLNYRVLKMIFIHLWQCFIFMLVQNV